MRNQNSFVKKKNYENLWNYLWWSNLRHLQMLRSIEKSIVVMYIMYIIMISLSYTFFKEDSYEYQIYVKSKHKHPRYYLTSECLSVYTTIIFRKLMTWFIQNMTWIISNYLTLFNTIITQNLTIKFNYKQNNLNHNYYHN